MKKSYTFLKLLLEKNILIALMAVFLFTSCATLDPFISDFNLVSTNEEIDLGNEMHEQLKKEMSFVSHHRYNTLVQKIGAKLVAALPVKEYHYQFYVVNDPSPNAFAIPGGKIYTHTGLIEFISTEDELAGVLAHEIGHVYEKHPAKALTRQQSLAKLSQSLMGQSAQPSMIQQALYGLAGQGIMSRYGRGDETESDIIAHSLLQRAGYSTAGLLQFLERLQKHSMGSNSKSFLSSHPPTPERIALLKQMQN